MKEFFKQIKPLDIIIPAFILFITVVFAYTVYTGIKPPAKVIIKSPHGEWIYPLDKDTEIEITGSAGITKVQIKNGEVFVIDSICSNKTCIHYGKLKNTGDWNACLPNRVFLYIENN